ncbi:hypothetical protein ACFRNJ_12390 [Streptomyces sp. NPDC056721]|uniref:hypothetical protein n=1 Tax=Streptomyces sp. NPDC056721 TaxID=3345923 RepID=UPI0036CC0D90
MPRKSTRRDFKKHSVTRFSKVYGDRIYTFNHDVTHIEGWVSGFTTVRLTHKGDGPLKVGKVVHSFYWTEEID